LIGLPGSLRASRPERVMRAAVASDDPEQQENEETAHGGSVSLGGLIATV
jgi:hypothetical protein